MDQITDNSRLNKEDSAKFRKKYSQTYKKLLNRSINSLSETDDLLIYPDSIDEMDDIDNKTMILKEVDHKIKFQNLIGYIGVGDEQLTIHSRFSSDKEDYFFDYMLQKIFDINIVNMETGLSNKDSIFDLLKYLFPRYLNNAMKKGIFKQYKRIYYNDANIKGNIDIARHIKMNTPFTGKVAYSTREFSGDNYLMELIRHTIEYIRSTSKNGEQILNSSEMTRQNVSEVIKNTSTYNSNYRQKVILINQVNPIRHAYYTEYLSLQKLCLMILSRQKHDLGNGKNKINGIIFDVAWLWEEYLSTLISVKGIKHSHNRERKNGMSVFSNRIRTLYPDFYTDLAEDNIVFDAKYKRLEKNQKGLNRLDLFQMITYSYILKTKATGVVYPRQQSDKAALVGKLSGYGANIFKYGISIPQDAKTYPEFVNGMRDSEKAFKEFVDKVAEHKDIHFD